MRPGHPYIKSTGEGQASRHLPDADEFRTLVHSLGIEADSTVICYDDWQNHFATRMWWLLRYYGFGDARILDGGWQAWVAAGLPISFAIESKAPAMAAPSLCEHGAKLATLDQLLANFRKHDWQILDVRSDEEYSGANRAGNARGGHIPGAYHLEWKRMLRPSDEFEGAQVLQSAADMERLLNETGIDRERTIVVHCQAGVRASFMAFCLELLGYPEVKLYDASMAEWANLEKTPMESLIAEPRETVLRSA